MTLYFYNLKTFANGFKCKNLIKQLDLSEQKVCDLDGLVSELQKTINSKVLQNVELSVQFDGILFVFV